jgi:hypothetical protein
VRHDDYEPVELRRLTASLRLLHLVAHPPTGGSIMTLSGSGDKWPPEPDKIRRAWRQYLRRTLYELDQQSRLIDQAVMSDRIPRDLRGTTCPICRQTLRPRARYCDRCGTSLKDTSSEKSQGA